MIQRRSIPNNPTKSRRFNRGLIAEDGRIPDGMQFIRDVHPLQILEQKRTVSESISEAAGRDVKVLKITGIFQKADEINQNGRRYPLGVIQEAVQSIQDDVAKRSVPGEFDHPADAKIHLDRISHVITKLWMEGKNVYGVAEVIDEMPCGGMLATLLSRKVQVGISSRGVGDMEEVMSESRSVFQVLPGYQFVTWDVVGEPSVKEAIMSVTESRNRKVISPSREILVPTRATTAGTKNHGQLIRSLAAYLNTHKFK